MLPPTIEMDKNGLVAKSIDQRRAYHGTAEKVLQEFGGPVIWIRHAQTDLISQGKEKRVADAVSQ